MKKLITHLKAIMLSLCFIGLLPLAYASDHADPMLVKNKQENITGLFFFEHENDMILIFNISPNLLTQSPYDLSGIEYVLNIDHHSEVDFSNEANNARYGGTVNYPQHITADMVIKFSFDNSAQINMREISGFSHPELIEVYSGVRDDPFIFPRFFKKNVIATALRIPKKLFPPSAQHFLLWGQTFRDGEQIDHVGRSNRTQLARFDFINTLSPDEQVLSIVNKKAEQHEISDFLRRFPETAPLFGLFEYVFELRRYDAQPDVMIYSTTREAGFPNGRRLTDDVAGITCATGDCVLQEVAFIEGGYPRATVNDKVFLDEFPFLAPPWPSQPPTVVTSIFSWWGLYAIIAVILTLILCFAWIFYRLGQRSKVAY